MFTKRWSIHSPPPMTSSALVYFSELINRGTGLSDSCRRKMSTEWHTLGLARDRPKIYQPWIHSQTLGDHIYHMLKTWFLQVKMLWTHGCSNLEKNNLGEGISAITICCFNTTELSRVSLTAVLEALSLFTCSALNICSCLNLSKKKSFQVSWYSRSFWVITDNVHVIQMNPQEIICKNIYMTRLFHVCNI